MKQKKHTPEPNEIAAERARVLEDVSECLPSALGHFKAAFSGRSRKSAVTAFCIACAGFRRSAVRGCTSVACCLFPYRPYSTKRKPNSRRASP